MTIKIPVFVADEKINSKYLHGHVLPMHTLKDRTISGRKRCKNDDPTKIDKECLQVVSKTL